MAYDLSPLKTIEEKSTILSQAADENWVVVLGHDPNVDAATVEMDGPEFKLYPAQCPAIL